MSSLCFNMNEVLDHLLEWLEKYHFNYLLFLHWYALEVQHCFQTNVAIVYMVLSSFDTTSQICLATVTAYFRKPVFVCFRK